MFSTLSKREISILANSNLSFATAFNLVLILLFSKELNPGLFCNALTLPNDRILDWSKLNPLPNDKFLGWSKFKAFADNKINAT